VTRLDSLVVPVYRNAATIDALVAAIEGIAGALDGELEAIFVIDGSPDDSRAQLLRVLEGASFRSRVVDHARNFGSFPAIRTGLSPEQVELTRLAGSLHDLGKLAIPEEILRKAGELTDSERLVLERHPQIGFRMLDSLGVDPVADLVLHHHERWDGSGYPDGLRGEQIPLGARIIFVADAYDAMTWDRVYRPKRSPHAALAELERCAGTQFDPGIVAAFAEEMSEELSSARAAAPALAS